MNQSYPVPSPELVEQWLNVALPNRDICVKTQLCTQAAQWGADQELEACCGWLRSKDILEPAIDALRAARRPKPQTLNSVALQMLGTIERDAHYLPEITDTIRRAIEQLPN